MFYFSLALLSISLSLRAVGTGTQSRSCGGRALQVLLPVSCLASVLLQPWTTDQGNGTACSGLHPYISIEQKNISLTYPQAKLVTKAPHSGVSLQMTLACVKLTVKASQHHPREKSHFLPDQLMPLCIRTLSRLQPPASSWTFRLLTQLSLGQAYLPQECYEKQNDILKGSGRQKHPVKPQLVLMMLTACDCEERGELWGRGKREQAYIEI